MNDSDSTSSGEVYQNTELDNDLTSGRLNDLTLHRGLKNIFAEHLVDSSSQLNCQTSVFSRRWGKPITSSAVTPDTSRCSDDRKHCCLQRLPHTRYFFHFTMGQYWWFSRLSGIKSLIFFSGRWEWFRQHIFRRVLSKHRAWYVHMNLRSFFPLRDLKNEKSILCFVQR